MSKWFRPTEKDIEDIINMYQSGLGKKPIAKKYHCSENTVKKILENNGIEMHIKGSVSPYSFNEHFLDELDSPEKLYFLGWAYSDGNVNKAENLFRIGLEASDYKILEDLNKIIESNRDLRIDDGVATLSLTSKSFKERLIELGCIPDKSLVLKWPDFIPDEYLKDFIRGYFDGDGCIFLKRTSENKIKNAAVTICSTYDFVQGLREILLKKLGISSSISKFSDNSFGCVLCGFNNILKFSNWIYEDESSIKLERKYNNFMELKNYYIKKEKEREEKHLALLERNNKIIEDYEQGNTIKKLSLKYNLSGTTIRRIIKSMTD